MRGPFEVAVEQVPDSRMEEPLDAIILITTANVCGSDLHPYEGRAPLDSGMVLGHENMGVVAEVGQGVNRVKVGDRVSVPFGLMAAHSAVLRGASQILVSTRSPTGWRWPNGSVRPR